MVEVCPSIVFRTLIIVTSLTTLLLIMEEEFMSLELAVLSLYTRALLQETQHLH